MPSVGRGILRACSPVSPRDSLALLYALSARARSAIIWLNRAEFEGPGGPPYAAGPSRSRPRRGRSCGGGPKAPPGGNMPVWGEKGVPPEKRWGGPAGAGPALCMSSCRNSNMVGPRAAQARSWNSAKT
eukprot:scaffold82311_cov44-Prasinocladus_malaysianus.AAC.1